MTPKHRFAIGLILALLADHGIAQTMPAPAKTPLVQITLARPEAPMTPPAQPPQAPPQGTPPTPPTAPFRDAGSPTAPPQNWRQNWRLTLVPAIDPAPIDLRIAGALGRVPPLSVQPLSTLAPGAEAKAHVVLIPDPEPHASFRRSAEGAIILQVQYSGATLPDRAQVLPQEPAMAAFPALVPGRATTLADLGTPEILGDSHFLRQEVTFRLPGDWLLLASQKALFTLHYALSADLPPGAQLLVKVNGQILRLLPLDRDGGKVMPPLDMNFNASALNPGLNSLTFEMSVPGTPPGLPYPPRKTERLVILGDSALTVPPSPRMQQDDLSRSLAGLGGADIVIPPEVAGTAWDAASLVAFAARFRPLTSENPSPRLHIIGADNAGLVPLGDSDVTARILQAAVSPQALPPAEGFASAKSLPTTGPPQGLAVEWPDTGWLTASVGTLSDLAFPGTTRLSAWLTGKSGLALLVELDPEQPGDIWLIAGPNITMADLADQVDRFRRGAAQGLHSQAALLQSDGSWVTWSANRQPRLLEPLSLSNLRPVLGNYASWSPWGFTVLTLALALLSVIPALIFVLITRRKGSRI